MSRAPEDHAQYYSSILRYLQRSPHDDAGPAASAVPAHACRFARAFVAGRSASRAKRPPAVDGEARQDAGRAARLIDCRIACHAAAAARDRRSARRPMATGHVPVDGGVPSGESAPAGRGVGARDGARDGTTARARTDDKPKPRTPPLHGVEGLQRVSSVSNTIGRLAEPAASVAASCAEAARRQRSQHASRRAGVGHARCQLERSSETSLIIRDPRAHLGRRRLEPGDRASGAAALSGRIFSTTRNTSSRLRPRQAAGLPEQFLDLLARPTLERGRLCSLDPVSRLRSREATIRRLAHVQHDASPPRPGRRLTTSGRLPGWS